MEIMIQIAPAREEAVANNSPKSVKINIISLIDCDGNTKMGVNNLDFGTNYW